MVDGALRRLGEEVTRFGGTVDKFIGDNVMAVFGAPVSHEDDPERAVRAGLAMQAAMAEINERIPDVEFALRVGINSGEVLAGQVGEDYTVMGDAVNVASRLQSAARPGTVTVGEITHRLTRAAIEYVELEPLRLKGKAEPVAAWEAVRIVVTGHDRDPRVDAADRPRGRVRAVEFAVRPGGARRALAPGHGDRTGGRRQEPAPARARRRGFRAPGLAADAGRPLPRLRLGARLLGARRGRARAVPDRRHGRLRGGLGEAALRLREAVRREQRRERGAAASGWRRRSPARSASRSPTTWSTTCCPRARTRSRPAPACSAPCARWSRPPAGSTRWCLRSRTSTGPTRACST